MNKADLKRIADMLGQVKGHTDKIIITPIKSGITVSVISPLFMSHLIITKESLEKRQTIYVDQLEFIKAQIKGMKTSDDITIDEVIEKFGSSDHHLSEIEKDTFSPMSEVKPKYSFQIDFKLLERSYKSIAADNSIIKVQLDEEREKALISNTRGDISLVGLFTS